LEVVNNKSDVQEDEEQRWKRIVIVNDYVQITRELGIHQSSTSINMKNEKWES